jgi:hypothetical protein
MWTRPRKKPGKSKLELLVKDIQHFVKTMKSVYRLYDSQRRCSLSWKPSWLRDCSKHHSILEFTGVQRRLEISCMAVWRSIQRNLYVLKRWDGNVIQQILGMSKIFDPVLLEEIIQYSDDGNFWPYYSSRRHWIAMKLDPIMGKIGEKETKNQFFILKKKNSLFRANANIFTQNKNKLFR